MDIFISESALNWFIEEMDLEKGEKIKFFSKIYGSSPVQEGFTLGFTKDNTPLDMAVRTEMDGIDFYVEERDLWFFNGHNLHVDYNAEIDELEFDYVKPE